MINLSLAYGNLKANSPDEASKKEIELAIIHSFVNNDKWRLFYVYRGLIEVELKQNVGKEESKKGRKTARNAEEFFSPFFLLWNSTPFFCFWNLRKEQRRKFKSARKKSQTLETLSSRELLLRLTWNLSSVSDTWRMQTILLVIHMREICLIIEMLRSKANTAAEMYAKDLN